MRCTRTRWRDWLLWLDSHIFYITVVLKQEGHDPVCVKSSAPFKGHQKAESSTLIPRPFCGGIGDYFQLPHGSCWGLKGAGSPDESWQSFLWLETSRRSCHEENGFCHGWNFHLFPTAGNLPTIDKGAILGITSLPKLLPPTSLRETVELSLSLKPLLYYALYSLV